MTSQPIGAFALVLHAHLPYVLAHGRWPHGTDWLNEAAAETYIPLLSMLNGMAAEGRSPRITIGVTPVLTEQFADASFQAEFRSYLRHRIEAARADQREFEQNGQLHLAWLAREWETFFKTIRRDFERRYGRDLVGAFRALQDEGHIELITSAATHGYLPLLGLDASVRAQIRVGVETYRLRYGRAPAGIWLPECAYRPRYTWTPPVGIVNGIVPTERAGIEEVLAEHNLAYFIVDAALVRGGEPIGTYLTRFRMLQELWQQFKDRYRVREEDITRNLLTPYYVASSRPSARPVAVFARDPDTGRQVWSGEIGYPGDANYLEFHKKRFPGGLRYWRVTGPRIDLGHKQEYVPDWVEERVQENAAHFCGLVKDLLRLHYEATGRPGVVCAPFDAELFGHWWFEGVRWLKAVLTRLSDDPEVALTTCRGYLERYPPAQTIALPEGSWGEGGYHYIWLNQDTEWVWKLIYPAEVRLQRLLRRVRDTPDGTLTRIVTQAARELLLLEASDWPFVISTTHARDYAHLRIDNHHQAFTRLAEAAEQYHETGRIDPDALDFLAACEARDGLFPRLDMRWFEG